MSVLLAGAIRAATRGPVRHGSGPRPAPGNPGNTASRAGQKGAE